MRDIYAKSQTDDEFHVIDLTDEPVRFVFNKMVDGVTISSPDGDLFFGWDYKSPEEFSPTNAMLLKAFDNMKDFKKLTFTQLYLMAKDKGKTIRVYVAVIK